MHGLNWTYVIVFINFSTLRLIIFFFYFWFKPKTCLFTSNICSFTETSLLNESEMSISRFPDGNILKTKQNIFFEGKANFKRIRLEWNSFLFVLKCRCCCRKKRKKAPDSERKYYREVIHQP